MLLKHRNFSLLVSLASLSASAFSKAPSFNGMYVGGSIGYRNSTSTVVKTVGTTETSYRFSGNGEIFEGLFGNGKSWKRLYLGYEINAGMNAGKSKKGTLSLSNNFQFGLAARIGAPLNDSAFMPHFGFGFEYRQMKLKTPLSTKGFYNYSLAPLIGATYAWDERWLIRGELGYYLNLKNTALPATYSFKSKPNSIVLKGSVIYKIN